MLFLLFCKTNPPFPVESHTIVSLCLTNQGWSRPFYKWIAGSSLLGQVFITTHLAQTPRNDWPDNTNPVDRTFLVHMVTFLQPTHRTHTKGLCTLTPRSTCNFLVFALFLAFLVFQLRVQDTVRNDVSCVRCSCLPSKLVPRVTVPLWTTSRRRWWLSSGILFKPSGGISHLNYKLI